MTKQILRNLSLTSLLVLLLASCGVLTTPTPSVTPEPISLKLNWQHGVQFLGFYIAQRQGYYAEEGLDVTIEPRLDTQAIPELVAAGEYDFSVGGGIPRAQGEGTAVTAIAAIYQFGPEAFFARTDSGIVTPADLAGRRVVIKSPSWELLLEALLEHEGLTLADVEAVPGRFDMTPFIEGEVEVWAGFLNDEVVRARQQGLELVTIPVYEYGIPTVAQTVVTSQETLATAPNRTVRFLRASLRGWEWAVENPSEAVDIMLELYPDMAAEHDFHLASFDASIPLIRPPGTRLGSIDCEAWLAAVERHASLDSTEGLCTTTILEAAWEEMEP